MDRGAWQATAHGVARVGHDLATITKKGAMNGDSEVSHRIAGVAEGAEARIESPGSNQRFVKLR